MGVTVRISKEKMRFARGFEQNWTLQVFIISNVLHSSPQTVNKLEDIRGDGHFYAEQLNPFKITKRTEYLVDKLLDTQVIRGIREYLVGWRRFCPSFDS